MAGSLIGQGITAIADASAVEMPRWLEATVGEAGVPDVSLLSNEERSAEEMWLLGRLRSLRATPRSDWHYAFEALLRIETYGIEGVEIRSEAEIGFAPPRADYLVLTEDKGIDLGRDVFRIFKRINVLEYKNPEDDFNLRTIYKANAYANYLIGTAEREGDVPPDEVTVSVFRSKANDQLFKKLRARGQLTETDVQGIYFLQGIVNLPFQVVITGELPGGEYARWRALTTGAEGSDVRRAVDDASSATDDAMRRYWQAFLRQVADKNPAVFAAIREESKVSDVLMDLVKERVDERVNEAVNETARATMVDAISRLARSEGWSVERVMDVLEIPAEERPAYAEAIANHGK